MQAIVNLVLSSLAFVLSAAALFFNVVFNHKERKRSIRQTLTSTLNDVAKINVEISKLKKEDEGIDPDKINEHRNYDFQRNALCLEADFLIHENPKILTAIDCSLMAFTYNELHDFEKAEHYWKESISKAEIKPMKHIHSRDYASFLFQQNRIEEGRTQFKETLAIRLSDTDDDLAVLIDTYLLWASSEYYFGYDKEFNTLLDSANDGCGKVKNKNKHDEMQSKIENFRNISAKEKKEK